MIYQNLSEQLLLTRCSNDDGKAFHEVYQRYKRFVFAVVSARLTDKDEATDITQDIFVTLWDQRESLGNITDFKTYLYVLSRNQVVTAYRKKNVRLKKESLLFESIAQADHSPEDHRLANELILHIGKAVEQLPETMRNCYHLSKNEDKKNREIAGILKISEKTVRNNVSEALKRLRSGLQKSHPELLLILLIYSLVILISL